MKNLAIMGAGGKMGYRITEKLKDNDEYKLFCIEVANEGKKRLKELGVDVINQDKALKKSDIVVLAVPDRVIKKVCKDIIPKLNKNTIVVSLDPAAPYAGVLPEREDITYFVVHPCHPPLFNIETDIKAQKDYFGGVAEQDLVCSLYQGPEEDYIIGKELSCEMFGPIREVHRLTVEEMAILEPALVETISQTLIMGIKEAYEKAIKMGVPKKAATGFLMGHIRVQLAIIFGYADFPFSDAAQEAIEKAKPRIYKEGWIEEIMNKEDIKKSVKEIAEAVSND